MKIPEGSAKTATVDRVLRSFFRWLPLTGRQRGAVAKQVTATHPLTITEVHAEYAQFVFRTLQQLGARPADLQDLHQEVFIAVHEKLQTYDPSRPMKPWLFTFCWNIIGNYRDRSCNKNELVEVKVMEAGDHAHNVTPEKLLEEAQRRKVLDEVLDDLDLDKRVVFVMFEIDEMRGEDIANDLGIPLNTVYSRLRLARIAFNAAVIRRQARLSNGGRP